MHRIEGVRVGREAIARKDFRDETKKLGVLMKEIYNLHIFGTHEFDCKWLFVSEKEMLDYLSSLPMREIEVEVRTGYDEETGESQYENRKFSGESAIKYWESHINITRIEENRFPKHHKLFKAPYYDKGYNKWTKKKALGV